MIAQVLANPPKSSYADSEAYYAKICPQLLKILDVQDSSDAKLFHSIACACVKSISEKSLVFSRRYLLEPLMEPLIMLTEAEYSEKVTEITEETLENSIKLLHKVFVICNDPSGVFLIKLEPVILVLLDLHCSITFGVSHLKQNVEDLVKRYLKCVSSVDAVRGWQFE